MAEDRQTEIRGAFDAAAADFTALGRHLWEPIGTAAVRVADPRPGERVLDACCGTGASAIPTARLVGSAGHVDAVDLSGPMVEELWRRSADLSQLRAHQADVTTWAPGGYDLVQSALGIFFFPDMTAGTDHLISRARPGGRVVFTIWRGDAMAAAGRHLGLAIAEVTNTPPPAPRPPHLFDQINQVDSYADWLAETWRSRSCLWPRRPR
jgi:SAM-dependent methyltransferase